GPGIGDGGADRGRTALRQGRDLQVAEREAGVGEPVTERVQRGQALCVVPAVPDVDSLGVLHGPVLAGPLRRRGGRHLRQRRRERDGQVPGRVGLAEQQRGDGRAVLL